MLLRVMKFTYKVLSYIPGKHHINPHNGYFRSIQKDALYVPARTHTEYFDLEFHNDTKHVDRPYLNGRNCKLPHKSNYLSYARAERDLPDSCRVRYHDNDDVVRFVFQNFDDDEHPLHLHGNKFWVLYQGIPDAGPYNAEKNDLNLEHPTYRDTATVNGNSSLVIQVHLDNPGIWFFHCHNDWHMNIGLGFIVAVDVHKVVERLGRTEHLKKCEWY